MSSLVAPKLILRVISKGTIQFTEQKNEKFYEKSHKTLKRPPGEQMS